MTDEPEAVVAFQRDVLTLEPVRTLHKYYCRHETWLLQPDVYDDLRYRVAKQYDIHISEVVMVGSARLGFSIVPDKRYQPFGDHSDLDLALVSPVLFDELWQQVFRSVEETWYWPKRAQFVDYLFRGWVRPDKMPSRRSFSLPDEWFEFFRRLTATGQFGEVPIKAGVYRSWSFLESYQLKCFRGCVQAALDKGKRGKR